MTTAGSAGPGGPGTAGASSSGGSGSGELLHALSDDMRALLRQELRSAQAEMTGKARRAGKGAAMLGGAAVLGALATGTSAAILVRMLENVLPRTAAALFATSIYTAGAALLAVAGAEELRRALPVVPEAAVEGLREDVQAASPAAGTADTPDHPE